MCRVNYKHELYAEACLSQQSEEKGKGGGCGWSTTLLSILEQKCSYFLIMGAETGCVQDIPIFLLFL